MTAQFKSKRVLLAYRVNQFSRKLAGVFTKLLGQADGFEQAGAEVFLLYMSYGTQTLSRYERGELRPLRVWEGIPVDDEKAHFWQQASEAVDLCQPEVVYTRYDKMYGQGHLADFLARTHGAVETLALELATYPYADEIPSAQNRLQDAQHLKTALSKIDFLFSTAPDANIENIINNTFSNQLHRSVLEQASKSMAPLLSNKTVNLLGVANLSYWHGYDRVLEGMANYVRTPNAAAVMFHIVGQGEEYEHLVGLVKEYALQKYVIFYGHKSQDELSEFYHSASAGLDCLAMHRKDVLHCCSLKSREYLANGLPVIYASHDPLLEGLSASLRVATNESPLDIGAVVNFLKQQDQIADIRSIIRSYARKHVSWTSFAVSVLSKVDNHCRVPQGVEPDEAERLQNEV